MEHFTHPDPLAETLGVLVCVGSVMETLGLRSVLEPVPEVAEIEAGNGIDDVVERLRSRRFDVVIVPAVPPFDGLERIVSTAREYRVRTVVLLRSLDVAVVCALGRLPVDGFLLEDGLTDASLRSAMTSLAPGAVTVPGRLARPLLARVRTVDPTESPCRFQLVARERQALALRYGLVS